MTITSFFFEHRFWTVFAHRNDKCEMRNISDGDDCAKVIAEVKEFLTGDNNQ